MIICDDRQFAFIHIPKCAGSSVRRALRPLDTSSEAFFRIADHPVMGPVHLAHLTLANLAEFYPETFEKLARYRSMAIVRDPLDRFTSAVFQRLREFRHVPQSAITRELFQTDAEVVISNLQSAPARIDLQYVHFNRQCDFIEFDGNILIGNLFALERMPEAADFIRQHTGIEIDEYRRNPTTELRFAAVRPMQRLFRDRYAKLVSAERRAHIREAMTRAGFYSEVPKNKFVEPGGPIDRFVHDYYARDFAIHDRLLQQSPAPAPTS